MEKLNPNNITDYLEKIESQAESILNDKSEIVSLDKRRNMNREALRNLNPKNRFQSSYHVWACVGNMFIKLPRKDLTSNVEDGKHSH